MRFRQHQEISSGFAHSPRQDGQAIAAAWLRTIGEPHMAVDRSRNLFVSDYESHSILKFTPTGVRSTWVSGLGWEGNSREVAVDGVGNLFAMEGAYPQLILKIAPDGTQSTFATLKKDECVGLICDGSGNLFVFDRGNDVVLKFSPDGAQSRFASPLSIFPELGRGDMAMDRSGNLFLHDNVNKSIYKITPDGIQGKFFSAEISPDERWEYAYWPHLTENLR